ncbi:MAG: restriction endonuclease [Nitrososphaerales archaeon]|nr:restriction endonuclease [Nitrososphaerales archaeon]
MPDLLSILIKKAGSKEAATRLLYKNRELLGIDCEPSDPGLVALSLCSLGVPPRSVSLLLSWQEFEAFSANLIRSSGYQVRQDVRLRKPKAQIDLAAFGTSAILSVDCKHWKRDAPPSTLAKLATDQLRRSALLRQTLSDRRPILSAILTLTEQTERFVDGVAVVSLYTLRDFLRSVEEYKDLLTEC